MKGLLTILCLSSSLAGCQKPDLEDPDVFEEIASQAIDLSTLEAKRVKGLLVLCIPNTEKPYSGWVKETHDNGQLKRLGYLNDGAKDGPWTSWHENGRKQLEIRYEKDVMHGIMSTWYPNGQKRGRVESRRGNGRTMGRVVRERLEIKSAELRLRQTHLSYSLEAGWRKVSGDQRRERQRGTDRL